MPWKQIKHFTLDYMGSMPNWCLMNTRLAFGIDRGFYASAMQDMQTQIRKGTFHYGEPPKDIECAIYYTSTVPEGHVAVWSFGKIYSDGKRIKLNDYAGFQGWGEFCDNERIVMSVANDLDKYSDVELAYRVIYGKYGNNQARKDALGSRYDAVQKIVTDTLKYSEKFYKVVKK